MKYTLILLCNLLWVLPCFAQSSPQELEGAWETTFLDQDGKTGQLSMIIQDGYLSMAAYNLETQDFIATLGGPYRADWSTLTVTYHYDTSDSTAVGSAQDIKYTLNGDVLAFNNDKVWKRVDANEPGQLAGTWQITGRKRNGEMRRNFQRGARKTIKILSGTRFQWIAFNHDTGEFFGTGGGTYTTTPDDGLYIERIEFFSRDPERVGAQLSFDYKIRNEEWHHSGSSSKGKPIYETWGRILGR